MKSSQPPTPVLHKMNNPSLQQQKSGSTIITHQPTKLSSFQQDDESLTPTPPLNKYTHPTYQNPWKVWNLPTLNHQKQPRGQKIMTLIANQSNSSRTLHVPLLNCHENVAPCPTSHGTCFPATPSSPCRHRPHVYQHRTGYPPWYGHHQSSTRCSWNSNWTCFACNLGCQHQKNMGEICKNHLGKSWLNDLYYST